MTQDDHLDRLSASQRAGIVAAAASVPWSLVPLLKPRSPLDQGVITGLSSALNYALTTVGHDVVLVSSRGALRLAGARTDGRTTARTTLAVDLAAIAVSLGVQAALPQREQERTARALVRAASRRITAAAVAGAVASGLDALPGPAGSDRGLGRVLRSVPVMVVAGAGIAVGVQALRLRRSRADGAELGRDRGAPMARSLGAGALAATGALTLAAGERGLAWVAERGIRRVTGEQTDVSVASHVASLGAIGGGLYAVGGLVYRRVERSGTVPDAALVDPPTSALVSGGPGSVVPWATLTREPRRHLSTATPAARISAVMGEPAVDPVRVYVGLTSAATYAERVSMALAELERTGALDRSLLVLCSPTGTGYLNYAASSAWEYLSRGDCASVTLQYSLRPSPMSLDRVEDGRQQNHALWLGIAEALGQRAPADRPKVVIFGESLGAHTSQDPFLHSGTRGLRALFVQRALWLGTPYGSGWAHQVRDLTRGNVQPGEVLRVAGADEIDRLDEAAARAARYVLMSHDDDGVVLFGPELLWRSPEWLGDARPAAVPPQARWSIPITFLQTAIDMKNAMSSIPGQFVSAGHDYRADIARAVRFAFDLPCSDTQLAAIEDALRSEELANVATWS
ncbi:alpha/beta-hydrolase family protein [Actinotalea sp.]|uniref:alpha/beta-hydrolase family protein n=1 Tax=Actinotalea sp. TaxID=1872145 RepID=UPI002C2926F0|nr:alpha/beta-hydrolase family protein [Actinotalea sp.]HQY34577.1 alpha/beta-hydrolase family protein [Actinotalea sp.]HRA51600.1 alpha/beta-hydrolase family protein [Actinotalea sp.]